MDAVMRIVDQVYPEVQPIPKIITENDTNLLDNSEHLIHKIDVAYGDNSLAISAQVDMNKDPYP